MERHTTWLALGAAIATACSVVGSDVDRFSAGGAGKVECPPGQTACGSECAELSSNPNRCGDCDTQCDAEQVCNAGECSDECGSGTSNCSGACVDTDTSSAHCGGCDQPCVGACVGGVCDSGCGFGTTECVGKCVDTMTDAEHCGGCESPCGSGIACVDGNCEEGCSDTTELCSGACVDLQSNIAHCGECDKPCDPGQKCEGGECKLACPNPQVECSGLCIDINNNALHCGMCDKECDPGQVCAAGDCTLNCPGGTTECSSGCFDTQTDDNHCGQCDKPCGTNEECKAGKCEVACRGLLNSPVDEPWGYSWDGLERPASTFADAEAACALTGGRLPTATELYRVSATQSGTVGQTLNTNRLWSLIPHGPDRRWSVRLSDAATSNHTETSTLNFRCVCPPEDDRTTFGGSHCSGPAGSGCMSINRYKDIDVADRAPLAYAAAAYECGFYNAHIASPVELAAAIEDGNVGTDTYLHTADQGRYDLSYVMRWGSDPATWTADGNMSWSNRTTSRPFRCAGNRMDMGRHPAAIAGAFTPATTLSLIADSEHEMGGMAVDYLVAHDTCLAKGGHLPRARELGDLIRDGLPNGTDEWVWTSDEGGYASSAARFYTLVVKWTDTEPRMHFNYPADVSWTQRNTDTSRRLRCVYYPVDTSYTGPAAADCQGGCWELAPTGTPIKMWFDSNDRPPLRIEEAMADCRGRGGEVLDTRDAIEGVRSGLPNGLFAWNMTTDFVVGAVSGATSKMIRFRWTGTEPMWTAQYSSNGNNSLWTWSQDEDALSFRCVWTNEVR